MRCSGTVADRLSAQHVTEHHLAVHRRIGVASILRSPQNVRSVAMLAAMRTVTTATPGGRARRCSGTKAGDAYSCYLLAGCQRIEKERRSEAQLARIAGVLPARGIRGAREPSAPARLEEAAQTTLQRQCQRSS
jgi:hypothetical protein